MSSTTLAAIFHGSLGVVLAVAATVLLALHDVDTALAVTIYGASIGLVGGSTTALLALKVPPS